MSHPVKWFTNSMRGAPILNGTAGSRLAVLDACLRTGFGSVTPSAVVVTDGVATATVSSGNTFHQYSVILIEGATGAWTGLNGEARVSSDPSTSTTVVTWPTSLPDGTATGSITIKYAPLGWLKPFEDVDNKIAVFKSGAFISNGHFLQVSDAVAQYAVVRGYRDMADASGGSDPFPTTAQAATPTWWGRTAADATPSKWSIAGDDRFFQFSSAADAAYPNEAQCRGFGDAVALSGSDLLASVLSVSQGTAYQGQSAGMFAGHVRQDLALHGLIAAAGAHTGGAAITYPCGIPYTGAGNSGSTNALSGEDSTLGAIAAAVDGQLRLSRLRLGTPPRANLPGLFHCPQSGGSGRYGFAELVHHGDGILMMIPVRQNLGGVATGFFAIDIVGPWR